MQINLSMENCWGIVRALVDVCGGLEDGKWLLGKDPNKPLLRLYSVPADAFKVRQPGTLWTDPVLRFSSSASSLSRNPQRRSVVVNDPVRRTFLLAWWTAWLLACSRR